MASLICFFQGHNQCDSRTQRVERDETGQENFSSLSPHQPACPPSCYCSPKSGTLQSMKCHLGKSYSGIHEKKCRRSLSRAHTICNLAIFFCPNVSSGHILDIKMVPPFILHCIITVLNIFSYWSPSVDSPENRNLVWLCFYCLLGTKRDSD